VLAFGPRAKGNDGQHGPGSGTAALTWAFMLERVTRIELALSAWELAGQVSVTSTRQVSGHLQLSVSSRRVPF
jgi:hypothetical protein